MNSEALGTDCKDVQADLELHCPHIEGLVQDYSDLILQERVKTDLYSRPLVLFVFGSKHKVIYVCCK